VVSVKPEASDIYIRADAYEVCYCLQTTLSYLLRIAAEEDRIELRATVAEGRVAIVVTGRATVVQLAGHNEADYRNGQVRAEVSLGRSTLRRLANRNHGEYVEQLIESPERVAFVFTFPVVRSGVRR
jgi:hypothetical protein